MIKYYTILLITSFVFNGCYKVGYEDFLDFKNARVGTVMYNKQIYKYKNSGELGRGDFEIIGQGLVAITKNKKGDLIYHIDEAEILDNYNKKEWVGKCKFYYIVDPKTYLIKSWGFEKDANPLSCRTWV